MRLKVLGGLRLEGAEFNRPKPLLLLAYLAVEGGKERRHVQELFWPTAADPATSLRTALAQIRKASPELVNADDRTVKTALQTDLAALQAALEGRDPEQVVGLYRGQFLDGFSLPDWSAELEEWVYSTREFVASRACAALIRAAEAEAGAGAFERAARWAGQAYQFAQEPGSEDLERLYPLLLAGESSLSAEVRKRAGEYGLEWSLSPQTARRRYFAPITPEQPESRSIPHNLPRSKTSFVGRDPELVDLGQVIGQPQFRLITLMGPGGVGKTRLALQLAANQLQEGNFLDGIYWVALEALSEPSQIPLALAQSLGLPVKNDPLSAVKEGIGEGRLLLVLDNFEHLVDEALLVSELLETCPNLCLLVTSRERLNLEEEYAFALEGLPLPQENQLELAQYNDAVRLFVQRAKRARLEFALTPETLPHVLSVCEYVEGSPLGIELAAVWLRSLPIAEIAGEIGKIIAGLEVPLRNIGGRHQSLRAVFEHSWRLLKPKEQRTLARLSVFADGFSREAASQVSDANIPLLTSLVDKSLLRLNPEGRYDFHPLIYEYAREKLTEHPEEAGATRANHAHYFLSLIEASSNTSTQAQIKCAQAEHQNLLTALNWSQEHHRALMGLRLGHQLALFWNSLGHLNEGRACLERVLSHPGAAQPSRERSLVLVDIADFAVSQGDYPPAQRCLEEALVSAKNLELTALAATANLLATIVSIHQGDLNRAQHYAEEAQALARKLGNEELIAQALLHLAGVAVGRGDLDESRQLTEQGLELFRKLGLRFKVASTLNNLGFQWWFLGDLQAARLHLEESITLAQSLPDLPTVNLAKSNLGGVMQDLGEPETALRLAREALEFRWEQNDRWGLSYSLENFADLAVAQGDPRRAAHLWGAAERLRQQINAPRPPDWKARQERFISKALGQLEEASFSTAWQQGREMGLEAAVRCALELPPGGRLIET